MRYFLSFIILCLSVGAFASEPIEIELLFAGDAMQHMPQVRSAQQKDGSYSYTNCFAHIKDFVSAADYAVVNLECPLAGKPYSGYPQFSAPDEYGRDLHDAGFDLFQTTNNHALDRRDKGATHTLNVLDSLGVPHVGTYRNIDERNANVPFIADIKGIKIAFLAYTYGTNGISVQKDFVVDYINRDKMKDDITKARNNGAEMVCVMLHWGIEYQTLPNKSQTELANWLMSQGVDLIIGGHPHVIQPYKLYENTPMGKRSLVVYSLGNFISNQTGAESRGGGIVKVKLEKNDNKTYIKSASYSLVFVQKPNAGGACYELIPADREDLLKPASRSAYHTFINKARALLNKHNINVAEELITH